MDNEKNHACVRTTDTDDALWVWNVLSELQTEGKLENTEFFNLSISVMDVQT